MPKKSVKTDYPWPEDEMTESYSVRLVVMGTMLAQVLAV